MDVRENKSLAQLTTFNIGGNARYFVDIENPNNFNEVLDYANAQNLSYVILAGGSNVLISDSGFNGLVIKIGFNEYNVDTKNSKIYVGAGHNLMGVVRRTATEGLSGMESLYGIPGTIGGAVRGNAGAFGTEISDITYNVTAFDTKTRKTRTFSRQECVFAYRESFFKKGSDWVILSAIFSLSKGNPDVCLSKTDEVLALRNERQIQNIQSAGSFFMNPKVNESIQQLFKNEKRQSPRDCRVPAGWIIDKAGFRNMGTLHVCTGNRSSNYIINKGDACAENIINFTTKIKEGVYEKFHVILEEEITRIGF